MSTIFLKGRKTPTHTKKKQYTIMLGNMSVIFSIKGTEDLGK